jgi:hypothetical protein
MGIMLICIVEYAVFGVSIMVLNTKVGLYVKTVVNLN